MLWTWKQRCWHWSALAGRGPGRAGGLCCSGALSSTFEMQAWGNTWHFGFPEMWLDSSLGTGCCSSEKPLKKHLCHHANRKSLGLAWETIIISTLQMFGSLLSSTQSHFKKENSFAPLSKAVKSQIRALKYEFGFCRLQKGCGCDGAYLTVLGSFLMSSFSIYWVFKMSEK